MPRPKLLNFRAERVIKDWCCRLFVGARAKDAIWGENPLNSFFQEGFLVIRSLKDVDLPTPIIKSP